MIKQENFSAMKGHIYDGAEISTDSGTVKIVSKMWGWSIIDSDGGEIYRDNNGQRIESYIVNM